MFGHFWPPTPLISTYIDFLMTPPKKRRRQFAIFAPPPPKKKKNLKKYKLELQVQLILILLYDNQK